MEILQKKADSSLLVSTIAGFILLLLAVGCDVGDVNVTTDADNEIAGSDETTEEASSPENQQQGMSLPGGDDYDPDGKNTDGKDPITGDPETDPIIKEGDPIVLPDKEIAKDCEIEYGVG